MSRATIKDVASLAEVSLKTVSRVINKEPTVKQATVDKVTAAITSLGYEPNLAARNLRSTKSYALGLVYDNPNPYYVIDVQNGVLSTCRELGFGLQIHPCQSQTESVAEELIKLSRNSDLSGLVLAPPISEKSEILEKLRAANIDFVGIISGNEGCGIADSCICVDDRHASYNITQHLLDQGYQDIGFFWGEEIHKSSSERFLGYQDALLENNIALHDEWVLDGQYSFESGMENARKILTLPNQPNAIVCSNDEIAAGALTALTAAGKSVPKDFALTGFEDSPFSRHSTPPITTAKQATGDIAAAAARLLITRLRPQLQHADDLPVPVCFSPTLIKRASTDA